MPKPLGTASGADSTRRLIDMPNKQLARGLWNEFAQREDPFGVPNGMHENLRVIDDHLAGYSMSEPVEPGAEKPLDPQNGVAVLYTDGSYEVFNGGEWKGYPPLRGMAFGVLERSADLGVNRGIFFCNGSGWTSTDEFLTRRLADLNHPNNGAAMVARVAIVLGSVAALRNAPIDKESSYIVTGFTDGVRSSSPVIYAYDPAATSVEDGVTVVLPSNSRPGAFVTSTRIPSDFFAPTLDQSMSVLNSAYSGNAGVDIFVPDSTLIMGTVHLKAARSVVYGGTVLLIGDVDTVFLPASGWSGESDSVRVLCNHYAVRVGWDLKTNILGSVVVNNHTFEDQGSFELQHSADMFCAFLIRHHASRSIVINRPGVRNSWVKPNGVTGDDIGPNRNTTMEGYAPLGAYPTHIEINEAWTESLFPEEDSDHVVFNAGQGTVDGFIFDVTINGGRCKGVQRRALKVIGGPRRTSGLRLLGDHHYEGSGIRPWNGLDISGNITVTGSGTMNFVGWLLGANLWSNSKLKYDGTITARSVWSLATVDGTFTRAVSVVGGAHADISKIVADGTGEALRVSTNGSLVVDVVVNNTPHRTLSVSDETASLKIGRVISEISENGELTNNSVNLLGPAKIQWIEIKNSSGVPISTAIRALSADQVVIAGGIVNGEFGNTPIDIENCTKSRINAVSGIPGDGEPAPRLVFVSGGNGVLVTNCTHPNAPFTKSGSNPPTNFHEFGNAAF